MFYLFQIKYFKTTLIDEVVHSNVNKLTADQD